MDSGAHQMSQLSYREQLSAEASVWNQSAAEHQGGLPPDWDSLQTLRHNLLFHRQHVNTLLSQLEPRMKVLEIGCGTGWLTIAAAGRGAFALGIDIAQTALMLGRAHANTCADRLPGTAAFMVADASQVGFPPETFDAVLIKGTLHHLLHPKQMIRHVYRWLVPGGLLWISDTQGHVSAASTSLTGAMFMVLPTKTRYLEKLRTLARLKSRAMDRMRASLEAEGLSPFEGIGREADWLGHTFDLFSVVDVQPHPIIGGFLAGELTAPDRLSHPFLQAWCRLETFLIRVGVLSTSALTLTARKPRWPTSG